MEIEYNKDLTRHNTFGMKVSCACYVEYDSVEELKKLYAEGFPQPVLHIGGGSNLLFTGDFPGTVFHSNIRFIRLLDCPGLGVDIHTERQAETICPGYSGSDSHFERSEESAGTQMFRCTQHDSKVAVEVGAGVAWDAFCSWCAESGLWGAENLSGIPGDTGAAAVQNIGAYGVEVKDIIKEVRCFDTVTGTEKAFKTPECRYGYRNSVFKDAAKGRYVVTSVVFGLSRVPNPHLEYGHLRAAMETAVSSYDSGHPHDGCGHISGNGEMLSADVCNLLTPGLVRNVVLNIRESKLPDPARTGNAGSYFKNPVVPKSLYDKVETYAKSKYGNDFNAPHFDAGSGFVKVPAAWLIEQCGWKGHSEGNVGVYDRQPLVIVNVTGKAKPDEVITLERKIMNSVLEKFGIELHPEVEHV